MHNRPDWPVTPGTLKLLGWRWNLTLPKSGANSHQMIWSCRIAFLLGAKDADGALEMTLQLNITTKAQMACSSVDAC